MFLFIVRGFLWVIFHFSIIKLQELINRRFFKLISPLPPHRMNRNASPSKRPWSLSFRLGITSKAMKLSSM